MKIEGIDVTGQTIIDTINNIYPNGIIHPQYIESHNLYYYTILFGIRISTCDTSLPDDMIGAVRYVKAAIGRDYWEIIISSASTEPSPYYVQKPLADAKYLGGTAWVKEGQYFYQFSGDFKGEPSFKPTSPMQVYRWNPTQAQINYAIKTNKPLSSEFELAKLNGQAKLSLSSDTLIHRTWSNKKLYNDSAGCQVFGDNNALRKIGNWAEAHKNIYPNLFTYNLFTKDEFLKSNLTYKASIILKLKNIFNKF